MNVLWLTPNKPENISVGRQRIASHLGADGFDIDLRPGGFSVILEHLRGDHSFDVVVGTTRAGAIAGMVVSALTDRPLVVDHVDPIRQFEETNPLPVARMVRYLECFAFRFSSHTLYVYPEEEKRVRRFASEATETALGVDYELFADPGQEVLETARGELSKYDLHQNLAIYVGGLEPIYHIRDLVESISYLENWSLLVLGSGTQSEYVTSNADGSTVVFLGTVPHDEVPGYLHAADVGVSLVDDPNTLKVLEYGATRLPTVQLAGRAEERLAGMAEFCEPNPKSIAAGIKRANHTDKTMLDGLQNLAAEHSWKRIAGDYADVLRSVVSQES
jgi:glycosyltransferase involved in cell wall biosynthesis